MLMQRQKRRRERPRRMHRLGPVDAEALGPRKVPHAGFAAIHDDKGGKAPRFLALSSSCTVIPLHCHPEEGVSPPRDLTISMQRQQRRRECPRRMHCLGPVDAIVALGPRKGPSRRLRRHSR